MRRLGRALETAGTGSGPGRGGQRLAPAVPSSWGDVRFGATWDEPARVRRGSAVMTVVCREGDGTSGCAARSRSRGPRCRPRPAPRRAGSCAPRPPFRGRTRRPHRCLPRRTRAWSAGTAPGAPRCRCLRGRCVRCPGSTCSRRRDDSNDAPPAERGGSVGPWSIFRPTPACNGNPHERHGYPELTCPMGFAWTTSSAIPRSRLAEPPPEWWTR